MGRKRVYDPDATSRVCRVCNVELPVDQFDRNRIMKNGYLHVEARCRSCQASRQRNRKPRTRNDRISVVGTSDPALVARLFKYGLTYEEYQTMLVEQNGECAICSKVLEKPCIDHCHTTGKVRGLLCNSCNTGLGHFKDNPDSLEAAIRYLTIA